MDWTLLWPRSQCLFGADLLCANRLLLDIANRHQVDTVTFAKYACMLQGSAPFALTNIRVSGDDYQWLLADFPALTVPAFSAEVAKHGVEHHITTFGPPVF